MFAESCRIYSLGNHVVTGYYSNRPPINRVDIWFEAVPSPAGAGADRIASDVAKLQAVRDAGASRILVPEVVDTGHAAIDPLPFAAQVRDSVGLPTGIAVVTATRDTTQLAGRIEAADAVGVDTLLLVGPASGERPTGPTVTEALQAHAAGRHVGVVTIPTRRREDLDEPDRIIAKQQAGARFAVSQIIFDADEALTLRRDYCARTDERIPFYYSLAPVKRASDLDFLERLGVRIPAEIATRIRSAKAADRADVSHQILVELARHIAAAHEREGLGPFGFCISHVLFRNVPEAIELLAALRVPLATA